MATDASNAHSDTQLLHDYLGKQLDGNSPVIPLDEALKGFQEYYRQLNEVRSKVRQAEISLAEGRGKPLDVDALITRVRKRLAEQGITE
jgi:hypothetical protein